MEYLWFFNNQELIWHAWTILNIPQILPRLKIFTTLTNSIKWIYFAVTSFHGRITSRDCRLQTEEIHQNFSFSFLKQFLRIFTSDVCYSHFCFVFLSLNKLLIGEQDVFQKCECDTPWLGFFDGGRIAWLTMRPICLQSLSSGKDEAVPAADVKMWIWFAIFWNFF